MTRPEGVAPHGAAFSQRSWMQTPLAAFKDVAPSVQRTSDRGREATGTQRGKPGAESSRSRSSDFCTATDLGGRQASALDGSESLRDKADVVESVARKENTRIFPERPLEASSLCMGRKRGERV